MKLSDFLIRGRHLFGFLIPGVMWVASASLLLFKTNPLSFIEEGKSPVVRTVVLLALAYIVGFSLQTILFRLLADPLKQKIGIPDTVKDLGEQIERILKARLPNKETQWCIDLKRLPGFCKYYVLENSTELKNILLEKEDDINFLVANTIPGPLLVFSWFWYEGYKWWIILIVAAAAIAVVLVLRWRLKHFLRREKEEWYETFLVLELYKPKAKSES